MKTRMLSRALGVTLFFSVQIAHSQSNQEERGVNVALGVTQSHDDNVTQAPESASKIDSNVLQIIPTIQFLGGSGSNEFKLRYSLVDFSYQNFSDNDHTDHHLVSDNHFAFNARNSLDATIAYHQIQNLQDSLNRADPEETEGNQYHYADAGLVYHFGAPGAAGQLEIGGNFRKLAYDNNLDSSSLNKFKDRDVRSINALLLLRLAPRTHALLEGRVFDNDYRDDFFGISNKETLLFTGLIWEITGKTSGSLRVGSGEKRFDVSGKDSGNYTAWEVAANWSPKSYSRFKLTTSRVLEEGSVREDYVEHSRAKLAWNHDWSETVSSEVSVGYDEGSFSGGSQDGREDETTSGTARLEFEPRAWVSFGVKAEYYDRESNDLDEQFERNVYGIDIVVRF